MTLEELKDSIRTFVANDDFDAGLMFWYENKCNDIIDSYESYEQDPALFEKLKGIQIAINESNWEEAINIAITV